MGTLASVAACSVGACVVDSWVDLRSGPDASAAVGAVCAVGTDAGPSELLPPQAEVRAIAPNRAGTTSNKPMILFSTFHADNTTKIPLADSFRPSRRIHGGTPRLFFVVGFQYKGVAPRGQPNGGTLQAWRDAVPACNITYGRTASGREAISRPGR